MTTKQQSHDGSEPSTEVPVAPEILRILESSAFAELRARLGRPVEFVARDARLAATSLTARATAYRQFGEHLQQRLNLASSPAKLAEEIK